jgi:CDP-glucose 4,6-dehydratase
MNIVNPSFWNKKRVLITGHTGFKGSWLSIWLRLMGAELHGYALEPNTDPSLFHEANLGDEMQSTIADIRNYELLKSVINEFRPEIIFHMAAQALVRQSYADPLTTFEVNVMGTANILEAARHSSSLKAIVNVTSDKCYANKEWIWGYREDDQLGGLDPYSNSKACSELVTQSFRDSFFKDTEIGISSVRAGNVIGGGDWSLDRLIPDFFRAVEQKVILRIRNPESIRPWQYVLEPLSGYLMLAQKLLDEPQKFSGPWNFGPYSHEARSVSWIVNYLSLGLSDANWKADNNLKQPHEAGMLNLDISKAQHFLNYKPQLELEDTLSRCLLWHEAWLSGENVANLCTEEIRWFMEK